MINIVTAGLREQEINVTQSWPGILKLLQANSAELRSSLSKLERFEQLNVLSLSPESRSNIISRPGSYQSGEFDTLINQHDRAAPIRNPVRGRTGFSESWGLLASVPSLPHPLPAPFPFLLSPQFSRD